MRLLGRAVTIEPAAAQYPALISNELSRYRNGFLLWDKHQSGHGACSDEGAVLRIGLVIALDIIEIVEIIHHQPVGLFQRPLGWVGEPIKPLKARAVAEMETSDGVDGQAAAIARAQIIPCRRANERFANSFVKVGRAPPALGVECGKSGAIVIVERDGVIVGALTIEPFGEV